MCQKEHHGAGREGLHYGSGACFDFSGGFIHLHAGDSFGELGVLYDVPRTATVRCADSGELLRIPGDAFLEALETWR